MKVTTKGQVTIPIEFREKLGLLPNTEVEFELVGNSLKIRKAKTKRSSRGRQTVEHLQKFKSSLTMSTEELMKLTRDDEV